MFNAIEATNLGKQFRHLKRGDNTEPLVWLKQTVFRRRPPEEHVWALRNVSFELAPGRMVGVIGRNGSGKSTLLRLIGGVMRADEGCLKVNGRLGALLDLGAHFHPDLSGRENVFVNAIISGLTRQEVVQQFDSIVSFAELEDVIDDPLRTYSTGMRMRLAFAVAAHIEADILLIDELLAVGDVAFQQKCFKQIEKFKQQGYSILLVSHDSQQITRFCDEALWLHGGLTMAYGDPSTVVERYLSAMQSETRRRTPATETQKENSGNSELRINVNRFGSQELKMVGIHLLNRRKESVTSINSGDFLLIEIEYLADEKIKAPIFGVEVYRSDGRICCNISTALEGISLPSLYGRGKVSLCFERLDLAKGEYYINVGAYEQTWSYAYDYHHNIYKLLVHSVYGDDKSILQPPVNWIINET
jgi:lipopolysaccharide transport system ATP-binding protein